VALLRFARLTTGAFALVVACASAEPEPAQEARTIIGLSTEGYATTEPVKHVVIRVIRNGQVQTTEVDLPTQKTEVVVRGGGRATVEVEGYATSAKAPGELRWVQRAGVRLQTAQTRLVRMEFDPLCVSDGTRPVATCAAQETCARGVCIGMERSSLELEPYDPNWFVPKPDRCRSNAAALATVDIGEGSVSYKPLAEGATLTLERGLQGGHHIWLAAKGRGFAEKGTLVSITGRNPSSGVSASAAAFTLSLTPAQDGSCDVAALRYQVDAGGINPDAFRGAPFDVTVEMRDRFGNLAKTTKRVQIAP
jgi:hypothetical protein